MRIDRTHRAWFIGTGTTLLVATLAYGVYSHFSMYGPSGGSIPGILFGFFGYSLMWYAFLLSVRKKFPSRKPILRRAPLRRLGSSQAWMRGHLWLGLLSCPLIFFHAGGIRFGHGLTRILMWIFSIVFASGILGAFLQHFIPRYMTEYIPMESIYNDADAVLEELRNDANTLMSSFPAPDTQDYGRAPEQWTGNALTVTAPPTTSVESCEAELRFRYGTLIKPYLAQRSAYFHMLSRASASQSYFSALRSGMPQSILTVVDQLEVICREKRDLDRQMLLHRYILHGWLLVHVPLSVLVIILGLIHAIMALHYL